MRIVVADKGCIFSMFVEKPKRWSEVCLGILLFKRVILGWLDANLDEGACSGCDSVLATIS